MAPGPYFVNVCLLQEHELCFCLFTYPFFKSNNYLLKTRTMYLRTKERVLSKVVFADAFFFFFSTHTCTHTHAESHSRPYYSKEQVFVCTCVYLSHHPIGR